MKKLVIFSGAGISQESGLPTFRGDGGIWESIDAEKVADYRSWYCGRRSDCRERRQAVLDFNLAGKVTIIGYYSSEDILTAVEKGVISVTCDVDTDQLGRYSIEALTEYQKEGRHR